LLVDPDDKVQEQAFWVIRNLAEDELGIDLVFRELGVDILFSSLITGLGSSNDDVVKQVRLRHDI
jgi:hypothetical protein